MQNDNGTPLLQQSAERGDYAFSVRFWAMYCGALFALIYSLYTGHGECLYRLLRTTRPVPGQAIQLLGSTTFYLRDPALNHPVVQDTVPFSAVAILVLCGIMTISFPSGVGKERNKINMLRSAAMGLQATVLTELLTSCAKNYTGFLRPNFYAGCGWSDDSMTCETSTQAQLVFRQSFPSGHSAHSACIAALVTLHLLRCASLSVDGRAPTAVRLYQLAAHVPGAIAFAIAASRVKDNWHHPADVVAGFGVGTACAMLNHCLFRDSGGASLVCNMPA
mmetsp:Transcript_71141/g.118238  ORF Transcript_71141/g.118238 Transcript_71141/m.118238 type:complete len:277 (+) Transcript_71141:60-890(+)|eukprot:CAMPEP_0119322616 /NCGR_PEP_ID=MMETSP1333-20130426/58700_1 /TAXON_ID=418940 /ORGANISM="Scyphosphaera apsteinii, Strain RCC1455" /LENGTH=276 /DNA_ID=CAMNT_0007329885 /DNA_START=60 /DNA_END=890 /DNA_ORIENTATION=+